MRHDPVDQVLLDGEVDQFLDEAGVAGGREQRPGPGAGRQRPGERAVPVRLVVGERESADAQQGREQVVRVHRPGGDQGLVEHVRPVGAALGERGEHHDPPPRLARGVAGGEGSAELAGRQHGDQCGERAVADRVAHGGPGHDPSGRAVGVAQHRGPHACPLFGVVHAGGHAQDPRQLDGIGLCGRFAELSGQGPPFQLTVHRGQCGGDEAASGACGGCQVRQGGPRAGVVDGRCGRLGVGEQAGNAVVGEEPQVGEAVARVGVRRRERHARRAVPGCERLEDGAALVGLGELVRAGQHPGHDVVGILAPPQFRDDGGPPDRVDPRVSGHDGLGRRRADVRFGGGLAHRDQAVRPAFGVGNAQGVRERPALRPRPRRHERAEQPGGQHTGPAADTGGHQQVAQLPHQRGNGPARGHLLVREPFVHAAGRLQVREVPVEVRACREPVVGAVAVLRRQQVVDPADRAGHAHGLRDQVRQSLRRDGLVLRGEVSGVFHQGLRRARSRAPSSADRTTRSRCSSRATSTSGCSSRNSRKLRW